MPELSLDTSEEPREPLSQAKLNRLGIGSFAVSGIGFLTFIKMTDRSTRTPAKGLGLFLATTIGFAGGTIMRIVALNQIRHAESHERGLLAAIAGVAIGSLTGLLTLNWLRTARQL